MRKESFLFDSDGEEAADSRDFVSEEALPCVKKFISNANPLLSKIQFVPYGYKAIFPSPLSKLPETLSIETSHVDRNNMALLEESAFQHNLLKQQVIASVQAKKVSENLLTLGEYYEGRTPVFEKYAPSQNSPCLATYLLKLQKKENIVKSLAKPNSRVGSVMNTERGRSVQFDSHFESGNLFRVYSRLPLEYDLLLQNDVNTKGNNQWFFFSIRNVPMGSTVRFNLVNMCKKISLFSYGMKPAVFSVRRFERRKIGWVHQGSKVSYSQSQHLKRQLSDEPYHCLSFEYKFMHEGDIVYFSYAIPYKLTDLSNFFTRTLSDRTKHNYVVIKNLGVTLGGNQVDLFEITNKIVKNSKKVVWVIGRQHSGEVTSGFMMEGVFRFLLSAKEGVANLLANFIFKIVPMINVDGVVHGNTRADLSGCDPNRKWVDPSPTFHPVIHALRKAIEKDGQNVEMLLDLHSHSRKFGTFFYGNSQKGRREGAKILPFLVARSDERFDFSSCRFSGGSDQTARKVVYDMLGIPLVYTVESSFYGYESRESHKIKQYLPEDYREMGQSILRVFAEMNKTHFKTLLQNNPQQMQELFPEIGAEEDEVESVGSDQDPSEDQFSAKQMRKFLPEKKKKCKPRKKQLKKIEAPKEQKERTELVAKPIEKAAVVLNKIDKESYYRKYFSGRCSVNSIQAQGKAKEGRSVAVQTIIFEDSLQVKSSWNNLTDRAQIFTTEQSNYKELLLLRNTAVVRDRLAEKGLCVVGQKVEEQVTVSGNSVNTQTEEKKFLASRGEVEKDKRRSFKSSLKLSRMHNENRFMGRMFG